MGKSGWRWEGEEGRRRSEWTNIKQKQTKCTQNVRRLSAPKKTIHKGVICLHLHCLFVGHWYSALGQEGTTLCCSFKTRKRNQTTNGMKRKYCKQAARNRFISPIQKDFFLPPQLSHQEAIHVVENKPAQRSRQFSKFFLFCLAPIFMKMILSILIRKTQRKLTGFSNNFLHKTFLSLLCTLISFCFAFIFA